MKKIIILILVLFITGCFDYQEINNTAIVTGIGLDYLDDKYFITYEILNIKSSNEEQKNDEKKYVVNANGDSITDAIINAENKIAKETSYSHLEVLLISNSVARNGISNIKDYFVRNSRFTNSFYIITSMSNSPKEVLSFKSINSPLSSTTIIDLLKTTNSTISLDNKDSFDYQIARIKDDSDIVIPNIKLNQEIDLDGMSVFKNNEYNYKIDIYETQIYGLLKKKIKNNLIVNDKGAIEIDMININYDYTNNINIDIKMEAKIKEINDKNFDLKDNKYLNELEQSFIKDLKIRIDSFIKRSIKNDSDILDFKGIIFRKTRNNNIDWHQDFTVNIDLHINRSGALFEVLS